MEVVGGGASVSVSTPLTHWISQPAPLPTADIAFSNVAAWRTALDAIASPTCPVWNRAWRAACDFGPSLTRFGPSLDNGSIAAADPDDYAALFCDDDDVVVGGGVGGTVCGADTAIVPLVYVPTLSLSLWIAHILPRIPPSRRFVLVTGLADWGPARCIGGGTITAAATASVIELANDPRIVFWWAEMLDVYLTTMMTHAPLRLRALPLGVDLHTLAFKRDDRPMWGGVASPSLQIIELSAAAAAAPLRTARDTRVYVFWGIRNRRRLAITAVARTKPTVYYVDPALPGSLARADVWARTANFSWVACVEGYGIDCHRTWEALVLGAGVVVNDCGYMRDVLRGFSVVFVKGTSKVWAENVDEMKLAKHEAEKEARRVLEELRGGGVRAPPIELPSAICAGSIGAPALAPAPLRAPVQVLGALALALALSATEAVPQLLSASATAVAPPSSCGCASASLLLSHTWMLAMRTSAQVKHE